MGARSAKESCLAFGDSFEERDEGKNSSESGFEDDAEEGLERL